MEMTLMETVQLLGLDLLALMLFVVVGLEAVENAVRSAWEAARSHRPRFGNAVASQPTVGVAERA